MTSTAASTTFSVGLEEGARGALVHSFSVPGCVSFGTDRDTALRAFPDQLTEWLRFLQTLGEKIPPTGSELEVSVDEWVSSPQVVAPGESTALFEFDRLPLSDAEIGAGLTRLGDLRGRLVRRLKELPDAELDRMGGGEWSARRVADELARAQWWTLSRLGASPLAEIPVRTVGRLDTAMALMVQRFTDLVPSPIPLEIEGELWTPRKVLRRLLWLEWTLGARVLDILAPADAAR